MKHDELVKTIIQAEEYGRSSERKNIESDIEVPKKEDTVIREDIVREEKKRTKVIGPYVNQKIADMYLVKSNKKGHMDEMTLVSPSNEFKIEIMVDNNMIYNTDFDRIQSISTTSNNLTALENSEGNYVLHILNIDWTDNFKMRVKSKNIIFNNVYVKYTEVVDDV